MGSSAARCPAQNERQDVERAGESETGGTVLLPSAYARAGRRPTVTTRLVGIRSISGTRGGGSCLRRGGLRPAHALALRCPALTSHAVPASNSQTSSSTPQRSSSRRGCFSCVLRRVRY
eukprot:2824901-Rhodomonas_salina.2